MLCKLIKCKIQYQYQYHFSLLISWVTNYSIILARNFSVNCNFICEIKKIAMATFCTSQCQDGDEVLTWNAVNEDVRAQKDALQNLNTQKSTSRRILTGILSKKF